MLHSLKLHLKGVTLPMKFGCDITLSGVIVCLSLSVCVGDDKQKCRSRLTSMHTVMKYPETCHQGVISAGSSIIITVLAGGSLAGMPFHADLYHALDLGLAN